MRFHHNKIRNNSKSRHSGVVRRGRRVRLTILGAAVVFSIASFVSMANLQGATVSARDFNAEIKALQNQINDYNKRASELSAQADTLQSKIDELQNRQNQIQAQIDLNETKKQQLEQEIADAEARIKTEPVLQQSNIGAGYPDEQ